ncbi:MAG: sugar ABC transporter ATP-binding protein [Halanaerobiaceae bacterium]
MKENELLRLENIEKSFPGVKALDDVNFSVKQGSVHVLCGENGAGKSTLVKIINGVFRPDNGKIIWKGEQVNITSSVKAKELGISMIFQELNYVPEMTVEENFIVGDWPTNALGKVKWREVRDRARNIMDREDLNYSPRMKLKDLTISDIQLIEIAKAVSYNADLIIMDEPTSAISQQEVEALFNKIRALKERGKSIIYISHKLEEVFEIADEISVLRDGKLIDTRTKEEYDKKTVITQMVGRSLDEQFPDRISQAGEEVLVVENLTKKGKFKNVNFKLHKGEIVGLAGLVGAGRTEVVSTIFGLDDYDGGQIKRNGEVINVQDPEDSIKHGIVMLSEDRKRYGVVPVRSVKENVTITILENFIYNGKLHARKEKKAVNNISREINIKTPSINTDVNALSGGNQQKVVLAKWLMRDPEIYLLDEPTRGIDVGAKYEIYKLMNSLAGEGKAILMISSELPELIGMCDRIYVMSEGEMTGELKRGNFSQEKIMRLAVGVDKKGGM